MSRTERAASSLRPDSDSRLSCISCCRQYLALDIGLSYLTAYDNGYMIMAIESHTHTHMHTHTQHTH